MMKEKIFEILKTAVSEKNDGDIIQRAEIVSKLIQYYRPGPKDSRNAGIRSGVNPIIKIFVNNGFLERADRGKYKILKRSEFIKLSYKEFAKLRDEDRK